MKPKTLVQCKNCNGRGVVPRSTDPHLAAKFPEEICGPCGGSGKRPLDSADVKEPTESDSCYC